MAKHVCGDQILGKRRYGAAVKSLAPLIVFEENGIIIMSGEERPPVEPDNTEAVCHPGDQAPYYFCSGSTDEIFHSVRCLSARSMLLVVIQLPHQFRPIEIN